MNKFLHRIVPIDQTMCREIRWPLNEEIYLRGCKQLSTIMSRKCSQRLCGAAQTQLNLSPFFIPSKRRVDEQQFHFHRRTVSFCSEQCYARYPQHWIRLVSLRLLHSAVISFPTSSILLGMCDVIDRCSQWNDRNLFPSSAIFTRDARCMVHPQIHWHRELQE